MIKIGYIFYISWMILILITLSSCGQIQSEYYEVHVSVVNDTLFYYIDPTDGKDTISATYLGEGESLFVYLYEAKEDVTFSYDQYFTTIEQRYVEKDIRNNKIYIRSNSEIDQLINQYFIDKESWENS
jgi:hypothetical protein